MSWGNQATITVDNGAGNGDRTHIEAVAEMPLHDHARVVERTAATRSRPLRLLPSGEPTQPDGPERTPGGLVRAAARGEALAWPKLVRRFRGLVGSIVRSHGLNDADVADVSQVVWIRLARNLDRLRDSERVAGWLATTTRYESLRLLRRRERTTPTFRTETLDRVDDTFDPDAMLARQERSYLLRELIGTLPPHQRRLMEMLLRDPQPSYKEISESLEIPFGSIGPTRQRCLAVLRQKCMAAGIEPGPA